MLSRIAAGFRLGLVFCTFTATFLTAQETASQPESYVAALQQAGIKLIAGPSTVKLGSVAEINLPAGYHAVEKGSLKKFYEFTRNSMGGDEVGVVIAPGEWMLFFDYDDVGYVKDDEKNSLDAPKLLKSMTSNQDAANEERKKRGWDEMKIAGWAAQPHYDTRTNNLKWAIKLTSSSDNHQSYWINESIRLLGRSGVMEVTLVTSNNTFTADSSAATDLLSQKYTYVAGNRYTEFKQGDKIAKYGLAALVLGGAGAVAAKTGLLAKFWKVIVAIVVAVGVGLKKIWAKITGREQV